MSDLDLDLTSSYTYLVNKLSNRERNRWARAGYPGRAEKDAHLLAVFCSRLLETPKRALTTCGTGVVVSTGFSTMRPSTILDDNPLATSIFINAVDTYREMLKVPESICSDDILLHISSSS